MNKSVKKAKLRYREKCKRLVLEFYPTEAALIEQVEKQSKKQTYIKDLIRKDMAAESDPFIEAIAALRAFDIYDISSISMRQVFIDRIAVEIEGEYFGVWDTVRKTFVD